MYKRQDQEPAEYAEPGLVTVETLPGEYEAEETEQARVYTDESIGAEQSEYETVEASAEYAEEPVSYTHLDVYKRQDS